MQKVKHDFQVTDQEIAFGNVCMIQNSFTFFRSWFMFKVQTINCMQYSESVVIRHFRVPKTPTFKMRPSAQPFLWKWLLFAGEWKFLSISKAEQLTSFWYRGLPLPAASTVYTPNAVRKLNRECFFLSLKRQVNSNPTTCSYIPKDYEKRSSTVSHWLKVLTTVTCHKFSPTDYRLPAAFFLPID